MNGPGGITASLLLIGVRNKVTVRQFRFQSSQPPVLQRAGGFLFNRCAVELMDAGRVEWSHPELRCSLVYAACGLTDVLCTASTFHQSLVANSRRRKSRCCDHRAKTIGWHSRQRERTVSIQTRRQAAVCPVTCKGCPEYPLPRGSSHKGNSDGVSPGE